MRILGWMLAGMVALLLGSGFAFLSGSLILGAVPAVSVLLIAVYLSWEAGWISPSPRGERSGRSSATTAYGAAHTNTTDGGTSSGGDCGFGGYGGGAGGL